MLFRSARRYLGAADLILLCVEERGPLDPELQEFVGRAECPVVLVRSKADSSGASLEGSPVGVVASVAVSVLSGEGLEALRALLPGLAYRSLVAGGGEAPIVTRARQRRALADALGEIEAFASALRDGIGAEVAAAHLRSAESAFEEVLGVISPDDVLDEVFRNFCIGK